MLHLEGGMEDWRGKGRRQGGGGGERDQGLSVISPSKYKDKLFSRL